MDEDSTDLHNPPHPCFTGPNPPDSLVSDCNYSGVDNCSEVPRFNIVVKEEPEDVDWHVDGTAERLDRRSSNEASPPTSWKSKKHQENLTVEKANVCTLHGKQSTVKGDLIKHHKSHTGEKQLACPDCGKSFAVASVMRRHMLTHTGKKTNACSLSGKCFTTQNNLKDKKQAKTERKPYSCSLCGMTFLKYMAYWRHKRFHTKLNFREHEQSCTRRKPYSFSLSGMTFSKYMIYWRHKWLRIEENPHSCSACGKKFHHKDALKKHQKVHTEENPYYSPNSGRCFEFSGDVRQHLLTHSDKKPHSCPVCGSSFAKAQTLKSHFQKHAVKKSHSCSVCGKQFGEKGALNKHQKVHTGGKPFSCSMCGKGFSSAIFCNNHQRTHTGVGEDAGQGSHQPVSVAVEGSGLTLPLDIKVKEVEEDPGFAERSDVCSYSNESPCTSREPEQLQENLAAKISHCCTVCGRDCVKLSKLRIHMRIHTGERSYPCSECGKQFSVKKILQNHQKIHITEKPYTCSKCDKFGFVPALKRHQQLLKDEKPISCSMCGNALHSSKNQAVRSKELSIDFRDKIVLRYKSGEGYKKIAKALNVPRSTVCSVIVKWRKFGTTETLPRTGRPAKLSKRTRRALVKEVTENPKATLKEPQSFSAETGETAKRTTISAALHQSGLYGIVARRKPLLSKKHMTCRLEFAKRHLNDTESMREKILWSGETKVELLCLSAKGYAWRRQDTVQDLTNTISMLKRGGGSIMLWGCFSAAGTGRLVKFEGKMNGTKYREVLEENLIQSAQDLRLGQQFIFQHDNNPNHTAKTTLEWLRGNSVNVLEWPSQSQDLNPIELLWRDLKIAVQQHSPSNLKDLERICKEEWVKLTKSMCAKLVEAYPRRLEAVVAAKGDFTKY
uniref:C2H2-type domain-containing protein n=2 Tax=Esox lucius TaxID=8010 RepID=A0AAY5K4D1_ESOLU